VSRRIGVSPTIGYCGSPLAAVDFQVDAGGIAEVRASELDEGARDIVDVADAMQRHHGFAGGEDVGVEIQGLGQRGADQSRRDGVDADAVGRTFLRHLAAQHHQCRLRGRVGAEPRERAIRGDRSDRDDRAAAASQRRMQRAREQPGGTRIDMEDTVPVRDIECGPGSGSRHAGDGEQHVHAAACRSHLLAEPGAGMRVGQVGCVRAGIGARGTQFRDELVERTARACAGSRHAQRLPAAACVAQQFQAGRTAHATGRAGNQRTDLASFLHRILLASRPRRDAPAREGASPCGRSSSAEWVVAPRRRKPIMRHMATSKEVHP
jgi:hypothetical protein